MSPASPRGSIGDCQIRVLALTLHLNLPLLYADFNSNPTRRKALEKALLAYHTTKMADINKFVKELWQRTYKNQDIDYIQARPCGAASSLPHVLTPRFRRVGADATSQEDCARSCSCLVCNIKFCAAC